MHVTSSYNDMQVLNSKPEQNIENRKAKSQPLIFEKNFQTINDTQKPTNNKIEFNDSFLKSLNFNSYSRKDEEKEFELVDWTICGNDGDDYDEDIKELETKFNPNNDTNDKSIEIKVSFFE